VDLCRINLGEKAHRPTRSNFNDRCALSLLVVQVVEVADRKLAFDQLAARNKNVGSGSGRVVMEMSRECKILANPPV